MYHETLLKLFCEYEKAKLDYETVFTSLIGEVKSAECMECSHPYSYAEFLRFQQLTKTINDKWLVLQTIQQKLLTSMGIQ